MIALITDAAPSANSSTSREVQDFINVCKENCCQILVLYPSKNDDDVYAGVDYSITCHPIFYKSSNFTLRFFSEVFIAFKLSLKLLFKFQSKIFISKIIFISPSIFNIFPALILKKRTRADLYLVLRDMFPFWLADIGRMKEDGGIFKFLRFIADFQMNASTFIGVESKKSLDIFLKKYSKHSHKAEILWNWMTTKKINDSLFDDSKPIKVIYAGSIGEAQGISNFIALLNHWKGRRDVEVHVIGRGIGVRKLLNFAKDQEIKNFYMHDQIETHKFDDFLLGYDIGLFFLRHDLKASNIPGKFMSYVMNGLPILGAVNPDNELISFVALNDFGYLESSGIAKNFLDGADKMISEYSENKFSRKKIQEQSSKYFSSQKAFEQIIGFRGPQRI